MWGVREYARGSSVELLGEPLRWRRTDCHTVTVTSADSFLVGTWLSLVEHSLGVRGVGSSNLPVPTIKFSLTLISSRIAG
jgi:hypothetical protein